MSNVIYLSPPPEPSGAHEWAELIRRQNGWASSCGQPGHRVDTPFRRSIRLGPADECVLREAARRQAEESRAPASEARWTASQEAQRKAQAWLAGALRGLPAINLPVLAKADRWIPLAGDPPELRAWLAGKPDEAGGNHDRQSG